MRIVVDDGARSSSGPLAPEPGGLRVAISSGNPRSAGRGREFRYRLSVSTFAGTLWQGPARPESSPMQLRSASLDSCHPLV
jgi:hypothetical protein